MLPSVFADYLRGCYVNPRCLESFASGVVGTARRASQWQLDITEIPCHVTCDVIYCVP